MIVLANGCFDRLHYGHLLHLEAASRLGEILIVSITADEFVNKGPNMPAYPDWQRAALVSALRCVTRTIVVPGLIAAMEEIKPDILVKGVDYAAGLDKVHNDYCKAHGIEIRFTDTPKLSARAIYDQQRANAPEYHFCPCCRQYQCKRCGFEDCPLRTVI